jgi:hypothetical protein
MASGDYSGEIGGYILNDEKSRRFHGDSIWIDPFSLKYSKGHPSVYDNSDLQTSLSSDFSGCNDEFVLFYIKSGRMFFDSITFYHHHDGSLFIVEGHSTLNISLSSIKHLPSSESPSPVPFVILSSEGILAIYSCSISDINLSSNSLIWLITSTDSSHSPNLCVFSVLIDSSNFTSISSNNSSILSTNFLEDIINVSFTLSIVNSIFNSITIDSPSGSNADSWFGGLFFIKFSQFTPFSNIAVNSSVFKDIKIVEKNIVGGVFYIYDNPSVTVFMNTTGSNISISQSGGFMYIGNEESIVSNLSVSSSKFNLCSSEYNGGCLYIDATISFQLLNSSFTSCSSTSGYGGVLALNSTEYMSYSHILQYYFSQVNFSNNSAGNGGNDIIDFSELCLNRIVEHTLFNFSSCSSTSSSVKFFVYDEPNDFTYDLDCLFDGVDSCKIKPIPIPFNIYISSDGTDESHGGVGCGLVVSNPCKTFGGGFETLRNEKPFDAEAVVYINTAGESSYEVNNLVLTESLFVIIAKSISNKPTITANFNLEISQTIPDFVICAGYGAEVTVSYLKFIHAGIDSFNVGGTTISNNTKGVIFVLLHSSSVLSIDNCDFTQAEESTSSKIYMVNSPFVLKIMGDLSLSNCRFSDFCISASKNNNSLHSIIYSNNDFGNTQFDNVSVSNVVCCDYYAVFASLSLASSSLSVFNISNCEFEMINISNILPGLGAHSFRYGGIISFVGNSQSSFYFSNNGVEEIQIDSNDVIDISGGGLYVVGEIFNLLISDSFFEGINGGYNGGAVYINLSSSTSAKIENSIFSECVANNYGGAIFVDNVSVSLSSCSFLSNSALSENSLIRGSDVYHNNYSSGNNYYTSSTVSSCCSTSSSLQFLINCTSDDILTCSKDSLFSVCSSENTTLDYNEFIISSDGSDEFSESQTVFCNSAAPCKTINVVLNFRLDRSLSKTYIINITSSGVNQSSISISGGKKLKLYGGLNGISKIHLCFNESSDEGKSFISLSSSSSSLFDTLSLVYCFVDNGFYFITVSDDSKVEIDNCLITSLSFFSSSQKSLFKISSFFSFSGNSNCGCSVSNSNFSQMSLSFKQNHSFFSFQNLGNLSLISCIFDDISSDDFDSTTSSSILFVFSKPSSSLLSYLSFTDISYSININSVINKNFFPKLISLYSFDSTFNNVNITISSTSESITHKISNDENDYILLFFSNSSLNVTNSNFYGLRGLSFIPEINSISEVSTFTSWTNGFLTLVKSTSTLDSCIFNNIGLILLYMII